MTLLILALVSSQCSFRDFSAGTVGKSNLVKFVNPLAGTSSTKELSRGNTYPAVCMPFGMNAFTPQTEPATSSQIYKYNSKTINGFRVTHQSNHNLGDYGAFSLMPVTGNLQTDLESRASEFSHFDEVATPYYYKVNLPRYDVVAEVAPTVRGGMMRFVFPESENAQIVLDCFPGESYIRVIPQQRRIIGYCKNNSGGTLKEFACYFVLQFSKSFSYYTTWNNEVLQTQSREASGENVGASIKYSTVKNEAITVQIATSFISIKQAIQNLNYELEDNNFDQVKIKANQDWNEQFNKIKVDGGSAEDKSKFYTALYRVLQHPRIFYELDEKGKVLHYSPFDGRVHNGYMFTDLGYWSGHKAVFPLLTLFYPEMAEQVLNGLMNSYNAGAWLPMYASPGYRQYGIGTHAAAIITDAYLKGIRNFDIELAYQAMKKNSYVTPPKYAPGRDGLKFYNDIGYVPNPEIEASSSKTLAYAYDDYCIYELANALNRNDDIAIFRSKALNYKNVFDPSINFMRGKHQNGQWVENFDPIEWGGAFYRGNAWHYTFAVPYDVQGLMNLMGGRNKLDEKLDSIFNTPPEFKVGTYKKVVHEMTEMVVADIGQYAHNNPAMHHVPHLYNYVGKPWKTQEQVRKILTKLYSAEPDGFIGDDDSGQLSAWFVFNSLGFYPVCPGQPYYSIGSPLFRKVEISLDNGKSFQIVAPANGYENRYIENATLNGSKLENNYISHQDILSGGTLDFEMNNKPNRKRGIKIESVPNSLTPAAEE